AYQFNPHPVPTRRSSDLDVHAYCADILELDRGGDWLVEEHFEQHPMLSALNPTSVNTIRVWVINHGQNGYEVVTAYLRMGRANVDQKSTRLNSSHVSISY